MIFRRILFLMVAAAFFVSCDDAMLPYYAEQSPGKVVIRGVVQTDSVRIAANGKLLEINAHTAFAGTITRDYEFVYYNGAYKNLEVLKKDTGETLHSYVFTAAKAVDTLSFFYKPGIWIDDVLSFSPGTLSQAGRTGYKFIFPTMNRYSHSGYEGAVDGIIRSVNGQVLGVASNIGKTEFGSFVEFNFSTPPIIRMELVKHGTTEPYITGQPVIVTMVMQANKSRLVVLEEKPDQNGTFSGVQGTLDLCDFFQF